VAQVGLDYAKPHYTLCLTDSSHEFLDFIIMWKGNSMPEIWKYFLICIISFGHYCLCNMTKVFFFFLIFYDADMADDGSNISIGGGGAHWAG